MITDAKTVRGFTLIETLVAISLLAVAIVAPMTLVGQSLSAAYYARDEITAYNLAQEGIESVRSLRDGHILERAINGTAVDLLGGIPINTPFIIDTRNNEIWKVSDLSCGPDVHLKIDPGGSLYGYGLLPNPDPCSTTDGWTGTYFTRTLTASYVGPASVNGGKDEIRVTVAVTWLASNGTKRGPFTIQEDMYRWVDDGTAAK